MVMLPLPPEDELRRLRLQETIDQAALKTLRSVPGARLARQDRMANHPSFSVSLPYPGGAISINRSHHQGGPRPGALTEEARAWMEGAVLIIRAEGNRVAFPWGPMVLKLSGRFRNERSLPDWDNILKPVKDCLARAADINDKDILSQQGEWRVLKGCEPTLFLEVTEWWIK